MTCPPPPRSHAILTFHVESRSSGSPGAAVEGSSAKSELRLGKIHLVDLAGSERLGLSQADGARMEETQNINSSLSALGDVLSALSKNAALMHAASRSSTPSKRPPVLERVPYRNSKLTHMLKDSLGGNSKTVMITTVRTGGEYFGQTSVSLEWSARAKTIRNKSLVNRNIIGDSGIQHVGLEMERLM